MTEFLTSYGIKHNTSSPYFPQNNGMAERFVCTTKQLLRKSSDLNSILMIYHATPLPFCNYSPSQLLLGRNIRTKVPQTNKHLIPKWPYLEEFKWCDQNLKKRQKRDFDCHNWTSPDNTNVWVTMADRPTRGHVVSAGGAPRSYSVRTSGNIGWNCHHLRVLLSSLPTTEQPVKIEPARRIMTPQQTGTEIHPPGGRCSGTELWRIHTWL